MNKVPLTKLQAEIMNSFYSIEKIKVIFDKVERNILWKRATSRDAGFVFSLLKLKYNEVKEYYNLGE